MNRDLANSLHSRILSSREKYLYYIMGISVATLGFIVVNTMEDKMSITHIPLGIGVLFLVINFWIGITYVRMLEDLMDLNKQHIDLSDGFDPYTGEQIVVDAGVDKKRLDLYVEIQRFTKVSEKLFSRFHFTFYVAIISIIAWRVIDMI